MHGVPEDGTPASARQQPIANPAKSPRPAPNQKVGASGGDDGGGGEGGGGDGGGGDGGGDGGGGDGGGGDGGGGDGGQIVRPMRVMTPAAFVLQSAQSVPM